MEITNGWGTIIVGALATGFVGLAVASIIGAMSMWKNQAVIRTELVHLRSEVNAIWKHINPPSGR